MNFLDGSGQPAGDPYGSMAYLSVVVPNRMNDGTTLPTVKVLAQGLKVPVYGSGRNAMSAISFRATRRGCCWTCCGGAGGARRKSTWPASRRRRRTATSRSRRWILNGNPIQLPRFQCNLALQKRRRRGRRGARHSQRGAAAADVRSERSAAIASGELRSRWSSRPSRRGPTARNRSNGGWPSYEFGDGSNGFSGILRQAERRAERAGLLAQHRGHAELLHGGVSGCSERLSAGQLFGGGSGRCGALRAGSDGDAEGDRGSRITTRRRGF